MSTEKFKRIIFQIKYRFGTLKEGVDYFTCGMYVPCLDCDRGDDTTCKREPDRMERLECNDEFTALYESGRAVEGRDFFTCGNYDFCSSCTKDGKPCHSIDLTSMTPD